VSPDNTATVETDASEHGALYAVTRHEVTIPFAPSAEAVEKYAHLSTRDLLILLHERFDKVETIAENVQEQFAPILEKIGNNPMLKMLLK
jgi:hypothetical protein